MAVDLSNPPAPPRRSAGQTTQAPKRQTAAVMQQAVYVDAKTREREEGANGLFQLAGFGLVLTKQYSDAGALGKYGPAIAHEMALLAQKNEGFAKFLDYLNEAGPYAGLITATMPLVLQILANHNMIKAEAVIGAGVVTPAALEAEVKADLARQTSVALRKQQEAEAELKSLATQVANANAEANGGLGSNA